jgi:hypothetical protein
MRRGRSAAFLVVAVAVLTAVQAVPASAGPPAKFGAKLRNDDGTVVQPANAPRECDVTGPHEGEPCTMVSLRAKGFNVGTKERAPKDGTIVKVRLVAHGPGSFRLFFAKAHPASSEAKVVKRGPLISFTGDNTAPYTIETKSVSISVKKGWYIAAKASSFETLTCTSGSQVLMEFQPPLHVGDPYQTEDDHNGCYLLVQLVYS